MTSSIILTGMPGCGKSTVGKALARELAVDFCDTDDLIVSNSGERLQDTIDKCGRDAFLELERKTILSFSPAMQDLFLFIRSDGNLSQLSIPSEEI